MPRDAKALLEALARGEEPEELAWAGLLVRDGRNARGGLADGEYEDGLHVREGDEELAHEEDLVRLAADERRERRYAGGAFTLHASPHPDGGWQVVLQGPTSAVLEGAELELSPNTWAALDVLPDSLTLSLPDGTRIALV